MLSAELTPARPAVPVAAWMGGKKLLAKRIIERIAAIPHTTYVEPFIGMGGVFLRRPFRAKAEAINDLSGDVANLFRVLQRHYEPFLDMLRWRLTSREEFHRLMAQEPTSLTDLERAARFIYLQRVSWGGKVTGRTFQVSLSNPGKFNLPRLVTVLEEVHERLAGVVIENLPYDQLIPRYDRPETLFYLDPPYWGCEGVYGAELFSRDEFTRLAEVLRGIKGRFILSLNDHPGVRKCFAGFAMEVVETTYAMGYRTGKETQRVRELLISNTGK